MSLDWSIFITYGPDILRGVVLTVILSIIGSIVALCVGAALALLLSGARSDLLRAPIRAYIEFFRGTPLLVQLFLLYYGGPHLGITLNAVTVGIIGLGLYGGAYVAEILRGGIESIPNGHLEAARSFGFSRAQRIRYIVLPQILVVVLPPLTNMLIIIMKDTAILSVITVPELTFQVAALTLETFAFVEPFAMLAIAYWILVELTAYLGRKAEKRVGFYLAH
jgi:polar amino acid transport system permease protein